jgi:hypothetical protein
MDPNTVDERRTLHRNGREATVASACYSILAGVAPGRALCPASASLQANPERYMCRLRFLHIQHAAGRGG